MSRVRLSFVIVALAVGCAHRRDVKKPVITSSKSGTVGTSTDRGVPVGEVDVVEQLQSNFSRVHFAFDSTRLTDEGGALLDENARILSAHPGLVVEIQGHADARGPTGYNLALGAMRAQAARSRLMVRGVSADRLPAMTYGEERPRSKGADASSRAENRRVEFRVIAGASDGVAGTVD